MPAEFAPIIGSTERGVYLPNMRLVRVDDAGHLEVVIPAGAPLGIDLQQVASQPVVTGGIAGLLAVGGSAADSAVSTGNPVLVGGVYLANITAAPIADTEIGRLLIDAYRRLRVVGSVLDDAPAEATEAPLKTGGVADAVLSLVADGDMVHFVTDLYRRLWVVIAGYDSGSNANRTYEVSPLNLQVLEESLVDTTNVAVGTPNYPSDDGLVMMGYKDFSITGKFICGADNTLTLTVWGTNDEDATPANRDWIQLYAYRTDANSILNSIACGAGATVTFAWDFDNLNYRYVRVRVAVTNAGPGALSNTVILKIRRKAL